MAQIGAGDEFWLLRRLDGIGWAYVSFRIFLLGLGIVIYGWYGRWHIGPKEHRRNGREGQQKVVLVDFGAEAVKIASVQV